MTKAKTKAKPRPQAKKIEFKYEYEFDGQPLTEVKIRPPKARDIRIANKTAPSKSEEDVQFQMAANLTDTTFEFVCDLEFADYALINEAMQDFLS